MVVLTARDEKRGLEALEKLKESGLSDHVMFHQLDVSDSVSVASLAGFIKTKFGKLDILVYFECSNLLITLNCSAFVANDVNTDEIGVMLNR